MVRGVDDIVLDLVFDAVGAVVVAVWDARAKTLFPVTAALAQRIRRYVE